MAYVDESVTKVGLSHYPWRAYVATGYERLHGCACRGHGCEPV